MKVNLPVSMFPLSTKATNSGGLVLIVLIGIAAFMAAKAKQSASANKGNR